MQVWLPWIHFTDEELEACGHAETAEEAVGMRNFHEMGWQVGCMTLVLNRPRNMARCSRSVTQLPEECSTPSDVGLLALSKAALSPDMLLTHESLHSDWARGQPDMTTRRCFSAQAAIQVLFRACNLPASPGLFPVETDICRPPCPVSCQDT